MIAMLVLLLGTGAFESAWQAGLTALNNNDLATAQSRLETAANLQPGRADVWLALAQTYLKQSKPDLAESAASKAEALKPADPRILHGLAIYYLQTGNYGNAADFAKRALAKQDRAETHALLAK